MARLSEHENYMLMLKGEIPEYVPRSGPWNVGFTGLAPGPGGTENFIDPFGVPYVVSSHANNGALPQPDFFILDDIRKWRDIIKRPAILDEYDYEAAAKRALDDRDPELPKFGGGSIGNGYFQMLVAFMGFNNGLIACLEEPDEVKDLLNFILSINLEIGSKFIDLFRPDAYGMGDDIAHERAPFVSEEVFVDIFEPMWRATVKPYKEAGCYAQHHNCGNFTPFVKYIVDMGFNAWNPAEPCSDLEWVKQEFGRKIAIVGGFDGNGFVCWPQTTEEEVRAYVRERMDLLAPGGGYAFGGGIMGYPDRNEWVMDEFEKNRYSYY
ncbi:MAG: hypothetical protein FWG88_04310 [Oscillospiraceae bacterium]|nr:hypothetical protein [Oscillospiraceae bacterium]